MLPMLSLKTTTKGFTLIELLIVLCMMVVLAAIAVPRFMEAVPRFRLKAAARELYVNMQKAKLQAIKEKKDWGIIFDETGNSYQICYETDAGGGNWTSSPSGLTCPPSESVSLNSTKTGITFGSGNASKDATVDENPITPPSALKITYDPKLNYFDWQGSGRMGYVYLANERGESYAIGSELQGTLKMKKWGDSAWE